MKKLYHLFKILFIFSVLFFVNAHNTVLAHTQTVVIKMTSDGFEPPEVTVDQNTIINFVNQDQKAHWPASNSHPIHDIYPEFDPRHAITPGELWIFKPTQVGTWKYHDHLFPHQRGTIIVFSEEGEKSEENTLDEIPDSSQSFISKVIAFISKIFAKFTFFFAKKTNESEVLGIEVFKGLEEFDQYSKLEEISNSYGLEFAWQYVKDAYTNQGGATLGGQAHNLAHYLGTLIFQKEGLDGLNLCDTTFAFGCYHGFTEKAFDKSLEKMQTIAFACEKLGALGSGPWSSCIHGIGHGVATYFNSTALMDALKACDTLQAGASFCHDGVFMEFAISAPSYVYNPQNSLYPCDTLQETYKQGCGRNQPSVMKARLGLNTEEIIKICLESGDTILKTSCIDSIGFEFANLSKGNHKIIVDGCSLIKDLAFQAQCVAAGAGEFVFQNYTNWQEEAYLACESLTNEFKSLCHNRVNQTAKNYSR